MQGGRLFFWGWVVFILAGCLGSLIVGGVYLYVAPSLPSIQLLKTIQLQTPLKIYTRDGALLGEFGNERREPLTFRQLPPLLVDAFLAAEDAHYFSHPGISIKGLVRASIHLLLTGRKTQGGGTITMQVARNFFLGHQKTYLRKIREVFLAMRIAHLLSKEKILTLYLNKIYFGNHAYGVAAAASTYYGVSVQKLTLAQMALLAGLPQAPSADNPIANARRARARRAYVLGRMLKLGYISSTLYRAALAAPVRVRLHGPVVALHAGYVAELVREYMRAHFGRSAYTAGYRVITTISSRLEFLAEKAMRRALEAYCRRYGYRGPAATIPDTQSMQRSKILKWLRKIKKINGLHRAWVTRVVGRRAWVKRIDDQSIELPWPALSWARPFQGVSHFPPLPKTASDVLRPGDVIYIMRRGNGMWTLAQIPWAEGAIVALAPKTDAIRALVGGFSFGLSNYDRATEARRQPGSSFKPFLYSAALHKGMTPATIINDAPIVVGNAKLGNVWRPGNYSNRFFGPTRLRVALAHSRNLVSVRVLADIGISYGLHYVHRFGFNPKLLPHDLTLILGSADVTPLQMARGYAVFANGGYLSKPYLIKIIQDNTGKRVLVADPYIACSGCERLMSTRSATKRSAHEVPHHPLQRSSSRSSKVHHMARITANPPHLGPVLMPSHEPPRTAIRVITAQNAYLTTSLMQSVIQFGTGVAAQVLHRVDLAGKTGTTNNYINGWFGGFDPHLVVMTYVGRDDNKTLGYGEVGARAALPMWIDFMGPALSRYPDVPFVPPPGIVTARIDARTGLLCGPADPDTLFEVFEVGKLPARCPPSTLKRRKHHIF
ncbi:MAG: penicillin-binding protein 1A [Gammaproteobacteria bacterium]